MTMYQKMKKIARPVVKNYHTDLTVHDLRMVRRMLRGETAIWAPRENGTYLHYTTVLTGETEQAAQVELDFFDAETAQHPGLQWYLLEKIGEAVVKIDQAHARGLLLRRVERAQAVSEVA